MDRVKEFIHLINAEQNFRQLKREILSKDDRFYTFDFKQAINTSNKKISMDEFWKLAKIKAKKVSLFVDEILSCEVVEAAPMGFIREITMSSNDITQGKNSDTNIICIKERVLIDNNKKTLLFFQLETTGKILLFAINQVIEEDKQLYFVGHYVYNIIKNSSLLEDRNFMLESEQTLPGRINAMILKMKILAENNKLDEIYKQLYN